MRTFLAREAELGNFTVTCNFYKLLLYDPGGF